MVGGGRVQEGRRRYEYGLYMVEKVLLAVVGHAGRGDEQDVAVAEENGCPPRNGGRVHGPALDLIAIAAREK